MALRKPGIQIIKNLLNKPLLIHADALNSILGQLSLQIQEGSVPEKKALSGSGVPKNSGGIAIIPVLAYLSNHYDEEMAWYYGNTSYDNIRAQLRAALADPACTGILLYVDSPGGEVSGCFDLVDEIYQARSLKPIYAVADETAFSAAYAIASAAEKIFIPRTAGAGSVGVICAHMDCSKLEEQIGIKYTAIFAGARKNDFSAHEPLSKEARVIAQKMVDDTYDIFAKTVARNRGVDAKAIRATEASLYFGKDAVEAGLVDAIMSVDKAMSTISKNKGGKMNLKAMFEKVKAAWSSAPAEEKKEVLSELGAVEVPQGSVVLQQTELDKKIQDAKTDGTKEGTAAANEKAAMIIDICALGGMPQLAGGYIKEGLEPDAVRQKVLEAKAAKDKRTHIVSTVSALGTGDVNPLLDDAKKRAESSTPKQK
jgi:signal peptide peptidase SppA